MIRLTYTGLQPIHVVDGGNWNPGDAELVSDGLAERLLTRPDFEKTPKKKAKAPAKATNQEVCADSSN
jgi:hypothetical protein